MQYPFFNIYFQTLQHKAIIKYKRQRIILHTKHFHYPPIEIGTYYMGKNK